MVRSLDSKGEEEDGWVRRVSEAEWRVRRRRMEEERDLRAAGERSDLMRPLPIIFTEGFSFSLRQIYLPNNTDCIFFFSLF